LLTESKQAGEALRASRDYLEKLTNSMWDAVFSVKMPERVIEWANDSFRLIGYEPSECIGRDTAFLYVNKNDFLDFGNKLKDAMAAGKDVLLAEQLLKRKSGENFPAEITVTFHRENEEVVSVTSIVRDITQRKQAEQSFKEAEAELKHTIEVVPGIIAKADAHTGYFTQCNPALSSILGFSSEEFLARPFIEFIHPDDRKRTINEIEKQLKGSPVARFENRYICKDGSYKWLEWRATPADEKGVVYAAATDITERKQAEEELMKKMNDLERFNRLTVDRELRMIELKKEVNDLLEKAGMEKKYRVGSKEKVEAEAKVEKKKKRVSGRGGEREKGRKWQ